MIQSIVQAIRARQAEFRRCYEAALRRDALLHGQISVRFTVIPDGQFTSARAAENTTGYDELATCVAGVVDAIRVPDGPSQPTTFGYPFVFAPQR